METDSSPRQSSLEDGLPSKIPRSDEAEQATPFLSEKAEPTVVIMEWHSCVICLEEMVDSDLLTHSVCGAMICPSCLQASRTHSATDNGLMPCPVSIGISCVITHLLSLCLCLCFCLSLSLPSLSLLLSLSLSPSFSFNRFVNQW